MTQKAAISHFGPMLVFGPGSKDYRNYGEGRKSLCAISYVPPEAILVVTFTKRQQDRWRGSIS